MTGVPHPNVRTVSLPVLTTRRTCPCGGRMFQVDHPDTFWCEVCGRCEKGGIMAKPVFSWKPDKSRDIRGMRNENKRLRVENERLRGG